MGIKSLTLCIITIFCFCDSVDVNYYSDKDPIDNEADKFQKKTIMGNKVLDAAAQNLTLYARMGHENRSLNSTKLRKFDDDTNNNSARIKLKQIFADYEYEYEKSDPEIDRTTASTEIVDSITFPIVNTSLIKDSDIFNLEPAIKQLVINQSQAKSRRISKKVWYVPEEYPCWRLPLLFGRLKHQGKRSDVFILKGPELHEIKFESKTQENLTPRMHPAIIDYCGRWCDEAPCYGDHTLCLFPNDKLSKMCGTGYKVNQLTVPQQNSVTNAMNKIRNLVALGLVNNLPPATNMGFIQYDPDLALISRRWLQQCLPGPATCSSVNNDVVTQLECKKSMRNCCLNENDKNCVPPDECFVSPLVGCVHAWFLSAFDRIQIRHINCAYITESTYNTAQIIWAETRKIGCAYGENANGDIRVICNFSPGARFFITTNFYCGLIPHKDITQKYDKFTPADITSLDFMHALGAHMKETDLQVKYWRKLLPSTVFSMSTVPWGVEAMYEKLDVESVRELLEVYENGTLGAVARLVAKYSFFEESDANCGTELTIYKIGPTASDCDGTSRVFNGLCFLFGSPYPSYRVIAIAAPVALFSLILYDLFNGVIRQTNY